MSNYLEGEGLILELNWIPGPGGIKDDLKRSLDEVFDTNEARSPTEEATSTIEEATSKSGSSVLLFIFSAKDKTNKINHGLLNRWRVIFILPWPEWGLAFNPNIATQTHQIFEKL
jgi:hypothetical protein